MPRGKPKALGKAKAKAKSNVFKPPRVRRKKGANVFKGPSQQVLNRKAREIGRTAGERLGTKEGFVKIQGNPTGLRMNLLLRRIEVARQRGDKSPIGKTFDELYRDALDAHDELISTSTIREFFTGLFEQRPFGKLKASELDLINDVADLISAVRLPTRFSGYSLDGEVMQHPSNRDKAIFGDPHKSASAHALRDTQRKDYVVEAMQRSIDAGGTFREIAREGLKAAIEFTLNYFTAPVTASNVLSFSRRAKVDLRDPELLEQVAARERMKDIYVRILGGTLRPAVAGETAAESMARIWAGPPKNNVFARMPPSPGRDPAQAPALDDMPMLDLTATG